MPAVVRLADGPDAEQLAGRTEVEADALIDFCQDCPDHADDDGFTPHRHSGGLRPERPSSRVAGIGAPTLDIDLRELGKPASDLGVPVGGSVLVTHRGAWGRVAESTHELGQGGAGLRREHGNRVTEVVPTQVLATGISRAG
jgi:hypothetical protein